MVMADFIMTRERARYPTLPSHRANLGTLPPEILEQIFLSLELDDRLSLSRVCRILHNIFQASATLQYQLALQTSSHLDVPYSLPPPSPPPDDDDDDEDTGIECKSWDLLRSSEPSRPLSNAEKLAMLLEREKRWETLNTDHRRNITVSGQAGVYELQEGIFLMCDEYEDTMDGRPTRINLFPLPTVDDPEIEEQSEPAKSHKLDYPIADLTMDPTQDLVVVSEHRPPGMPGHPFHTAPSQRYHLLSLSSAKPHPSASLPVVEFPPFTSIPMQCRQLLQVMGDMLLVLVSRYSAQWIVANIGNGFNLGGEGHEEELVVWNWKTGRVIARLGIPENGWFASIALLTPTSFMITSTSTVSPIMHDSEPRLIASAFPPVIQIYSFLPDPECDIVPVQPLGPDYLDDTTPHPVLVAQMHLPRFATGATVNSFDMRPDPAFPVRERGSATPQTRTARPFTQDPLKGVVVFDLQVAEPLPELMDTDRLETKSFELFALRETFIKYAQEGEERLIEARAKPDEYGFWRVEEAISWAEWGEANARLMDVSMPKRTWVCSCSGYRFISLTRSPSDTRPDVDEIENDQVLPSPPECDLVLYDFSPSSIRREVATSSATVNSNADEGKCTVKVISKPTTISKEKYWKDDVSSALPFRRVERSVAIKANGVMIDDQHVIVVCTKGRRNGDWNGVRQEMTVFSM